MQVSLVKGTFAASTTNQSFSFDGTKGEVKAVVFMSNSYSSSSTDTINQSLSTYTIGFVDESNNQAYCCSGKGTGTGDQTRGADDVTAAFMEDSGGTTRFEGDITIDNVNDEIDFAFTTAPNAAYPFVCVCFHGSDVSSACDWNAGTDTTVTTGFQPSFILTSGSSTSSAVTTNCAMNWGCSTGTANACWRWGAAQGERTGYQLFDDNYCCRNMFKSNDNGGIQLDTFTSTGFDVDFQDIGSSSDSDEPFIFLAIKCDNSVQLVAETELSAATGTQAITTTLDPEYVIQGGLMGAAAEDTVYYNGVAGSNGWCAGFADLSGGVGASGDYWSQLWSQDRSDTDDDYRGWSSTQMIWGYDRNGATENQMIARVSATSGTSLTIDKSDADVIYRMWTLVIEAEGGATVTSPIVYDIKVNGDSVDNTGA